MLMVSVILKMKNLYDSSIFHHIVRNKKVFQSCFYYGQYGENPGRTIRLGNGRFHIILEISWKQYSGERIRWQDLSGSTRNQQESGKTGSRARSPGLCVKFLAFFDGFQPEIHGILLQKLLIWEVKLSCRFFILSMTETINISQQEFIIAIIAEIFRVHL
jgi:hypothetical protein